MQDDMHVEDSFRNPPGAMLKRKTWEDRGVKGLSWLLGNRSKTETFLSSVILVEKLLHNIESMSQISLGTDRRSRPRSPSQALR
jgi:hypothetical protein